MHLQNDRDALETAYLKILFVDWKSQTQFDGEIPSDMARFWHGVSKYKDATGVLEFEGLASYALACLTFPVSNATVERLLNGVFH